LGAFGRVLESAFDVKLTGLIGFGDGLSKELEILSRTVRVVDAEGWIELEPDKRLVSRIVADYNLVGAKNACTPRTKHTAEETEKQLQSEELIGEEATRFRSATMRAAYLGQDRMDVAESVKALAQHMKTPRLARVAEIKRLARYLKGSADMVMTFPRRESPLTGDLTISVKTDSDWAGDLATRKSTSGVALFLDGKLVRHGATLQSVTALSSTEAEFYAATKGAALALGLQSFLADLDQPTRIVLYTDSSGALGFSKRRGLGGLRHMSTRFLWLQERVACKHLSMQKIAGEDNIADVLTKHLPAQSLARWLKEAGYKRRLEDGRYTDP